MFRIDLDRMRVLFSYEDRDLAVAFADLEGYEVVTAGGQKTEPRSFESSDERLSVRRERISVSSDQAYSSCPRQEEPGVWAYSIRKKRKSSRWIVHEARP